MPISATYNVKGGTLAQYDKVIEGLGEFAATPGGLAHIAVAMPDGFIVCDVWDSQESLDGFTPVLGPHIEAAGIRDKASPFFGHVENIFLSDSANQLPAVAVMFTFPGMSVQQYHDVLKLVNFEPISPSTRRAHIASATPNGMFVIAVWESEAAFRQFEPALHAAFADAGIESATPVIANIHRIAVNLDAVRQSELA